MSPSNHLDVSISPDDREWLAEYGVTMLHVQMFELTLVGLAIAQEADVGPITTEFDRLERLFQMTSGRLRRLLKIEADELAEDLATAVSTRNTLVHGYLLETRLELSTEATTYAEHIVLMRDVAMKFDSVRGRLDELTDRAQRARGIDLDEVPDFTPEQLRAMFRPEDPEPPLGPSD